MSDKKRSAKRKWKNALLAAALTASVILALPAWSVGPAEAVPTPSEKLVLKEDGTGTIEDSTLTIKRAGTSPKGTIEVDLYKVADAEKEPNYDAYKLVFSDEQLKVFGGDIKTLLENAQKQETVKGAPQNKQDAKGKDYNEDYRTLAEAMARKIVTTTANGKNPTVSGNDQTTALIPVYSITIGESSTGVKFEETLEPGMYLVIAHGENLTADKYVGMKDGKLVTMAYADGYVYNYLPELIALPMRAADGNAPQGAFTTAQNAGDEPTGNWQYEVTAELKAEEEMEMRDLTIGKTFSVPENRVIPGDDNCVYQIDAWMNGLLVYSEVVAINYKGNNHSVILPKVIPAKADRVTVTEVYEGGAFDVEGSGTVEIDLTQDSYTASFENTYNEQGKNGGVIVNNFEKGTEAYEWTPVYGKDLNSQQ